MFEGRGDEWLKSAISWIAATVLMGGILDASTPRLTTVLPRGVVRGEEQTLRLVGQRIGDVRDVMFYDTGISVLEWTTVDANNIDVRIAVLPDCRLGEHVVQIRTGRGFSDFRSVYVGPYTIVEESEPNSTWETAQVISRGVTVQGTITPEDVDYFVLELQAGERLSIEIEAIRLGTMFDPFIAVIDEQRFELAVSDDTPLYQQDGFISLVAPVAGRYTIMVREASYGGSNESRYRLHVGEFVRPTAVYPAGGQPGTEAQVTLIGDAGGPVERTVQLPESFSFREGLLFEDERGATPSPLPFRLNSWPNFLESEPNNTWPEEPLLSLPIAINGIISEPGDADYFVFEAKQGQVWDIECFARRIGSGLDPVINIYKADKSQVAANDDARGLDAYLRFQVPEDGQYYLRVRDQLRRGQADFVYRVEITPPQPALSISIPRVDRYSQLQQTIAIPRGNRYAVMFNAARENFGGPIELLSPSLPNGVTIQAPPMSANLASMPVVFEAAEDAEISGGLYDFRARLIDENQSIEGGFRNLADFALGEPNNARYYGCQVDRLAIGVMEPAPFRIELDVPQAPLVRDGSLNLRVVAHRDEGFAGPINLQFPFRPPGVGTTYQITMPADQSEIYYTLNAAGNAQLGKWPVYVIGSAAVDGGPLWVSTRLTDLEVAEPFVRIEAKRSACEQGEVVQVHCVVEQVQSFIGEATVQLQGLPPQVTCEPVTVTAETTEIQFQIVTNSESPLGNHKSLFCQIVLQVNGQVTTSVTGKTEFQINPPSAPVMAQPVVEVAQPEPAAAAPLSRLEQLRRAAQNRRQDHTNSGEGTKQP
ncbi:MAG TPA: pre-peptidase C-terminal domain-containing protein [Pirellulaceae bacterium]|nr:pre-peptidase C-terminal domain-containing protein [Pirellulaceae bacterium]